jgi:hypothetical protein
VRNKFEVRVDGTSLSQPNHGLRWRQPVAMREVNCYRVSDMADAAVLVFKGTVVPVGCGLEGETHHYDGHEDGNDPASYPRP